MAGTSDKKRVAILVPVWEESFTDDQLISLAHLEKYLARYDRFFLKPKGLGVSRRGYQAKEFPSQYFNSPETYNSLLKTRGFYEAFNEYEFILIYQLDCLVFRDELEAWCNLNYDYIGAPWHKEIMLENLWWRETDCVGNGGFSLRKVAAFIEFLSVYYNRRNRCKRKLRSLWVRARQIFDEDHFLPGIAAVVKRKYARLSLAAEERQSGVSREPVVSASFSEDVFFSLQIPKHLPQFRFAPPEIALRFAFEVSPAFCYKKNAQELPFGCHGWQYYDRQFWEPYLLKTEDLPK